MLRQISLSILDQIAVPDDSSPGDAIGRMIELARFADRWGYKRFWLAEHHGSQVFASSSPEVLVARLSAETQRIRLGSGGVLLRYYSPLKVAEVFRTLYALAPDRIDLGVCRSGGAVGATVSLLTDTAPPRAEFDFHASVSQLLDLVNAGTHELAEPVCVSPQSSTPIPVWVLGTGQTSAATAAALFLPYAIAYMGSVRDASVATELYKSNWSCPRSQPKVMLAVNVVCAESDEEALLTASSTLALTAQHRSFRPPRFLGVTAASRYLGTEGLTEESCPSLIYGNPVTVRKKLYALSVEVGAEEIMVFSTIHSREQRLRSFELLAGAFELASG